MLRLYIPTPRRSSGTSLHLPHSFMINHRHQPQRPVSAKVVQQILRDPLRLQQLGDRVYELLHQDLRHERERRQGYGRQL